MDRELEREALRVYRRYSTEVVEALGICPWAAKARREGKVRERVMDAPVIDVRGTVEAVREIERDPTVEIGLLIHPRLRIDRVGFERFVARVREAYGESDANVEMALAAFHPEADADLGGPERLIPFLRRTPDPTIQLVRRSVLATVRRAHGHGTGFIDARHLDFASLFAGDPKIPLHERVAKQNLETVETMGVERLAAILDDIRRDRDESYARISAA